jgi:hypothetical protein
VFVSLINLIGAENLMERIKFQNKMHFVDLSTKGVVSSHVEERKIRCIKEDKVSVTLNLFALWLLLLGLVVCTVIPLSALFYCLVTCFKHAALWYSGHNVVLSACGDFGKNGRFF